jgi:hypothetical protein
MAYSLVWERGAMADQRNKLGTAWSLKKKGGVVDTFPDFIVTKVKMKMKLNMIIPWQCDK